MYFSFFLLVDSIGKSRAQVATELLGELNDDVTGNFVEEVRWLGTWDDWTLIIWITILLRDSQTTEHWCRGCSILGGGWGWVRYGVFMWMRRNDWTLQWQCMYSDCRMTVLLSFFFRFLHCDLTLECQNTCLSIWQGSKPNPCKMRDLR